MRPDFSRPFIVQTNWSPVALGAILAQEQTMEDGQSYEAATHFASKKLKGAELHYSATEGECQAVLRAVKLFRLYLYGTCFELQTDHFALKWLMTCRDLHGKLARWSLQLQQYNMMVVRKRGRLHQNVDALTRADIAPLQCLLQASHLLDSEDEDDNSSCSSCETMSEAEHIQFLEARDLFVNAKLERIANLPDEVESSRQVVVVTPKCFVHFSSSSTEGSPMNDEPEEVRQLIEHSRHPAEERWTQSSEGDSHSFANEDAFTAFILGLSPEELEDFITGQQEDEGSSTHSTTGSSEPEFFTASDTGVVFNEKDTSPIVSPVPAPPAMLVMNCLVCHATWVKFKFCLCCGKGECSRCLLQNHHWSAKDLHDNAWICPACDKQPRGDIFQDAAALFHIKTGCFPLGMTKRHKHQVRRLKVRYT